VNRILNDDDKLTIPLSHSELVEFGRIYLLNNTPAKGNIACSKCSIVVTEVTSYTSSGEAPDVLGFAGNSRSVLLEAKASRSDFLADRKKHFRHIHENGVGNFRLYIAPKGLIKPEELPEKWGLLEVDSQRRIKRVVDAIYQEACVRDEKAILLSVLRRIGQNPPKGVSIRCYTYETKNRTTLTIESEEK